MLTKINVSELQAPIITKRLNGRDVSHRSAFASNENIIVTVEAPRRLGASAVVLRLNRDGENDVDMPLMFVSTDGINDTYKINLELSSLCGESEEGLFFYELLFVRGVDTLFTFTQNNVDFSLRNSSQGRFVLLVHNKEFKTPEWFHGRIMYHIFVDRFAKGSGAVEIRKDAVINPDWENGIPQYAEKQGGELANNMFFGGNLWGVIEKLEYLKSLGVGVIYLSPIFKAYSNHKYDTGDYMKIDGMFGGEEAFTNLIRKAEELDIKIMLDGVFNHTGDDSLYFDAYNNYGGKGAYSDPESEYKDWFSFKNYPDEYLTWWGIKILPKLNHNNDSCRKFFTEKGGVGEKYIKMGVMGWRLDVVDELNDQFLDEFCRTVKEASDSEAVVLGEVWENASVKIAYGKRRRYFRGGQLDSVMNYPLRNGILALLLRGDAVCLADTLKSVYSTYPKTVCDSLMNLLGTHDTQRILTVLGEGSEESSELNSILAHKKLTLEQKIDAIKKLKLAALVQYTVYGIPSVFYGDEAGLEGHHDPFCRKPYPWHDQNSDVLGFYKKLGEIRIKHHKLFAEGDFLVNYANAAFISYSRKTNEEELIILVNASEKSVEYKLSGRYYDVLNGNEYCNKLCGYSGAVLIKHDKNFIGV